MRNITVIRDTYMSPEIQEKGTMPKLVWVVVVSGMVREGFTENTTQFNC